MDEIRISTKTRAEMVDITSDVADIVRKKGINDGFCVIYSPHTTAGVTINENADPSVRRAIEACLSRLAPRDAGWSHLEGNADAHVKTSIVGSSVCVMVEGGRLALGTWQGIFFCEFDGPRSRRVWVKLVPSAA